jgi:iron(II)-dependent oxidoreductase
MSSSQLLTQLASLHDLMGAGLRQLSAEQAMARPLPGRPSMAWIFARSVYRETFWLREQLGQDKDLTERARPFFTDPREGGMPLSEQCRHLPPPEHLLDWAREIQDEHLRRLATPGAMPSHPLLADDRLPWLLHQENAKDYERMLGLRLALVLKDEPAWSDHRVAAPLRAAEPGRDYVQVAEGHYRIGAGGEPFAYDNELPPHAVQLSAFRIARRPVSNAQYLAFIEDGGCGDDARWPEGTPAATRSRGHPVQWRRDAAGHWFEVSLSGPADLRPEDPLVGIDRHEAQAYAAWAARRSGELAGAVLQHEYQWEVAARMGLLEATGRAWEWCANDLQPYPEYQPFGDTGFSADGFSSGAGVLRGGCLHTQPALRRASLRHWVAADDPWSVAGVRLVLPAG